MEAKKYVSRNREQIEKYGKTQAAVLKTIRIYKERSVLKAYLESREKEAAVKKYW